MHLGWYSDSAGLCDVIVTSQPRQLDLVVRKLELTDAVSPTPPLRSRHRQTLPDALRPRSQPVWYVWVGPPTSGNALRGRSPGGSRLTDRYFCLRRE